MLDKKSMKILKKLCKLSNNGMEYFESVAILHPHFSKLTESELTDSLLVLKKQELISCINADETLHDLTITYKGKTYFELHRSKTVEFVIKSVLIPC